MHGGFPQSATLNLPVRFRPVIALSRMSDIRVPCPEADWQKATLSGGSGSAHPNGRSRPNLAVGRAIGRSRNRTLAPRRASALVPIVPNAGFPRCHGRNRSSDREYLGRCGYALRDTRFCLGSGCHNGHTATHSLRAAERQPQDIDSSVPAYPCQLLGAKSSRSCGMDRNSC
jgi:hypothetical protein